MSSCARVHRWLATRLAWALWILLALAMALALPKTATAGGIVHFLIVEYRPVSKNPVPGSQDLYDYIYRVDVVNSYEPVDGVVGTAGSRLDTVSLPDASAYFGRVEWLQPKTSNDTITIRANRFFDRRLDKKTSVSGGWQYDEPGSDSDDRLVPGLPTGITVWSDQSSAQYYAVKFRYVFYWRMASRVDEDGPVITGQSPQPLVNDARALIAASYDDGSASGVDTGSVALLLDGNNVSGTAEIAADRISYRPPTALGEGAHHVELSVADKAGNVSKAGWSFTVDTVKPVVTARSPDGSLPTRPDAAISATYADAGGTGIDVAKVRLFLDNTDLTPVANASATGIVYTSPTPLSTGSHFIKLTVADRAGNTTESTWSLVVEEPRPDNPFEATPAAGTVLAADQLPVIGATYADGGANVDRARTRLLLDGHDVTGLAQASATGIRYTPAQPLPEGVHSVVLTLQDKAGQATEHTWNFVTSTPPVIVDLWPAEGSELVVGLPATADASYADVGSGIDPASVRITVDGADRTASADIRADGLLLGIPADALSVGTHTIGVRLADRAGNPASLESRFTVVPPATTVFSDLQPQKHFPLAAGSGTTISASYADPAGIDVARVRILVDGQDRTAQAEISATRTALQTGPLAPGDHTVVVTVVNRQGREAKASWVFEVEPENSYRLWFSEPAVSKGYSAAGADIRVVAASDRSMPVELTLNGRPMQRVAATGREVTYGASVELLLGDNELVAQALFADGRTAETRLVVNYGVPPVVAITAPADRSTHGPAQDSSPRDLTGNVERPITISGTASKPVASVTVNQQQAVVSGTGWRFDNFFLHEGSNLLTVVATDAQGRTGTASITVSVDQTAPFLSVEAPLAKAITSANTIDVRGTVNDAVEGYYGAGEPEVTVTGRKGRVTAVVADRQYLAADVPLELGTNLLTISARDQLGNERSVQLEVMRVAAGGPRLSVYGGNSQSAPAGSALPQPLTVAALDRVGQPLPNTAVRFDVTRGTGALAADQAGLTGASARQLTVQTDANGLASAWITLGKQSGPASNAVRASSEGIAESAEFVATGAKGPPRHIRADLGVNQYTATGSQPLEPLTAVVTDEQENRIANVDVKFWVAAGEARFENGSDTMTVKTDKNGFAAVRPTLGQQPGPTIVKATPAQDGDAFFEATFTMQGLAAQEGPTGFSGVVMNDKGQPLRGARVSIGRTALSATVDDKGLFSFPDVPPGKVDLFIDGRTVDLQGQQYPALHFEASAVKGAANQLPHPVYLPQLRMAEAQIVGGDQDVVLKLPGVEGFEMTVFANSVTFPDGSRTGPLVVSPISLDKLPMTPPGGYSGFMAPAITIQPAGTRFDPPVRLKIPNTSGFKPGEKKPVYQWDHDLATFVQMGQATVTEDGAFLVTDPGTGISKAGWSQIPDPPPPDGCSTSGGAPVCTQCQSLSTSAGKCQARSCQPRAGSCNDGLYCTKDDTCKGGKCTGTKIEDVEGIAIIMDGEVYDFGHVFAPVTNVIPLKPPVVKAALSAQRVDSCCEKEMGAIKIGAKYKLEAKIAAAVGPVWVPRLSRGFSTPIGTIMAGVQAGGELGFAISASKTKLPCEGQEQCWGGSAGLSFEVTGALRGELSAAGVVTGAVSGSLKTSVEHVAEVTCEELVLKPVQWGGIKLSFVVESMGFPVMTLEYPLVAPQALGEYHFPLPQF